MDKKKLIVLLGIHCAGKSTILNKLQSKGYMIYPEIANEIINETHCKAGPYADEIFENNVWERELSRDEIILNNPNNQIIIETWHLGNLANTTTRFPKLAIEKETIVYDRLQVFNVFPIFLQIPPVIIKRRTKAFKQLDEDIIDFYKILNSNIILILEKFVNNYSIINANRPIHQVYREVEKQCNLWYGSN